MYVANMKISPGIRYTLRRNDLGGFGRPETRHFLPQL
jgi:hypothetical protein